MKTALLDVAPADDASCAGYFGATSMQESLDETVRNQPNHGTNDAWSYKDKGNFDFGNNVAKFEDTNNHALRLCDVDGASPSPRRAASRRARRRQRPAVGHLADCPGGGSFGQMRQTPSARSSVCRSVSRTATTSRMVGARSGLAGRHGTSPFLMRARIRQGFGSGRRRHPDLAGRLHLPRQCRSHRLVHAVAWLGLTRVHLRSTARRRRLVHPEEQRHQALQGRQANGGSECSHSSPRAGSRSSATIRVCPPITAVWHRVLGFNPCLGPGRGQCGMPPAGLLHCDEHHSNWN